MGFEPDFEAFLKQYNLEKSEYENLSEYVLMQCQRYKRRHPNSVRVVFSRQPAVKEWDSIVKKIRLKRAKKPTYGYKNLEDLIGVTVLCAFESDKAAFVRWMHKAFDVKTSDKEAYRDDVATGHRGLHYNIEVHDSDCKSNPSWEGKKCEIQIKTLLEEAFDAKSHDLAYKPGHRVVSPELKAQFVSFSQVLKAVDQQSEFLKGLILAEEKKTALRRQACVSLYLANDDDAAFAAEHGLDPRVAQQAPDLLKRALEIIQHLGKSEPTLPLCRVAASYALQQSDDLFATVALLLCDRIVENAPTDANKNLGVATVEWALGKFESAMSHVLAAVKHADDPGSEQKIDSAMSTFVYLYADWAVMHPGESREDWHATAKLFVNELKRNKRLAVQDSLAFYQVVFGNSPTEIEDGRRRLHAVHKKAPPSLRPFLYYHEHVALSRLLKLLAESDATTPNMPTIEVVSIATADKKAPRGRKKRKGRA
ncbi:RelA/SpoT domain-containing protein [Hydrogenophaga borbori]|uniref:RelA/SpoT domain-containing protein n=1 Tax=Hydrogenophaga borbori TaxID=2294117 RepID=UPI00301CB765